MDSRISFILALVTLLIALFWYIYNLFRKNKLKHTVGVLLAFCVVAMCFLVYPLMNGYHNVFLRILASFVYATRCIRMGQSLDLLSSLNLSNIYGLLSFLLMGFLFVLMPILTASFIISFLDNFFARIYLSLLKHKEIHVFSEVNEKSLLLYKKLELDKNNKIVFTNVLDRKNIINKAFCIKDSINNIPFYRNDLKITFYLISEDEEQNLDYALELIDKYKDKNNIKMNIITNQDLVATILDSTDKGKINVEIIHEKERTIFHLLEKTPLFLNSINKTISLLIVGCGNVGLEFLKDATWCSMMIDYKLKILVIDKNADSIKEKIDVEMPDFLKHYNISFINADIESKESIDALLKNSDVNYVLVSMDSDDKNINTSIFLRRFYLRNFQREPIINLWISNEYKKKQISAITNEKKLSYNINAFGSTEDLYLSYNLINSNLEKLAKQIHLFYDSSDKEFIRYNKLEYNKRSSRASALHIIYKLYSVLGNEYTDDINKNIKLFKKKYSKKIENLLSENEHDRWNAYMRSIGYVPSTIKEVKEYYSRTNHYIDYLSRRHPALVEYNKLDSISKELSKIIKKKIDLIESDRSIVENIQNIKIK